MSRTTRRVAIWLLAPLLAATVGGEAWHLVPGNGHWLKLPGRCIPCGFSLACTAQVDDGVSAVVSLPESLASLMSADYCRICQLAGQARLLSQPWAGLQVQSAHGSPPRRMVEAPVLASIRSFDVRGPPSA